MSAGTYNFTFEQGATFSRQLTVQDNGSAMDLTNYSARMQLRSSVESTTVALTVTCAITNASSGILTVSNTATQTMGVDAGIYVYDLEIESSAGVVTRLMQGTATITANVTR
jgi:hypothetical protein